MSDIFCFGCQKKVATAKNIRGIYTWFSFCSDCAYGVKGWTNRDFTEHKKKMKMKGVVIK